MDDSIQPQIEELQESLTNLEQTLLPILTAGPLSTATSTLPLLDKAKLYVLATYALESILFSYLRLNGVNAKEHEVYKELARVKEYFSKISVAEGRGKGASQPRLDKGAARRFIGAGLAGNPNNGKGPTGWEKWDDLVGKGKHKRFEEAEESVPVVKASEVDDEEDNIVVKHPEADQAPAGGKRTKRVRTEEELKEKSARKKAKRDKRDERIGKRYQHLMDEDAKNG